MMGKMCLYCKKIIRKHTRKDYIHKSSSIYKQILPLLPPKGESKPFSTLSPETIIHHTREGSVFIERPLATNKAKYILAYCSEECYKKKQEERKQIQLKRNKHQAVSEKIRPQILEKFNHSCVYCGSKERLEVHHIKPFSEGGEAEINNFALLCYDCHKIVSNKSSSTLKKWAGYSKMNPIWVRTKKDIEKTLGTD